MKNLVRSSILVLALFSVSASATDLGAQANHGHHTRHQQYKLIDLGTLGGPSSLIFGLTGPINESGMVLTESADTAAPNPFYPNDNPYLNLPFVQHAFLWFRSQVRDLGTLPNGVGSGGQWINDYGVVAGAAGNGLIDSGTGYPAVNAVRWRNGNIRNLGTFGGEESIAFAINNRDQIAGGASNGVPDHFLNTDFLPFPGGTQVHAFRWERGEMQDLGTLGGPDSIGFYINERGEVAGQSLTNSTPNPSTGFPTVDSFLWKDGRMIDLGNLGGTYGAPNVVNNHSQIAGFSNLAGDTKQHPFFWERGVLTDIGTFGGDNGEAIWMNDAGQVVGTADLADGTHHAFVWQRGRMRDVGTVGTDPCSNGKGINSWGLATGTTTDCNGNILHLFLWKNGEIVNLSALIRPGSDVTVTDLAMINDRGEIAGEGVTADGNQRAILLVPDGDCDDECERGLDAASDLPVPAMHSAFPTASTSAPQKVTRHQSLARRRHSFQ
ncbi:MAG TPA: hypothetical protein VJ728_03150 [Candidatus Binataceae bacterium]|nr:hypothetical protein [Candidatus Binataceae bacterium]